MRNILTVFLTLLCFQLFAQQTKPPLQVGLGLTGIAYTGDLSNQSTQFQRIHPGGNLSLQAAGMKHVSVQFNAGFGKFIEQADALNQTTANTFVETTFFYGDLRIMYHILVKHKIRPYISAGAGALVFAPRDANGKFLIRDEDTRKPDEEKYNTAVPQLPATAGAKYKINDIVDVSIDYTYRFTPTDFLDNIAQLGRRQGFDVLHSLQLSVYFTLRNP